MSGIQKQQQSKQTHAKSNAKKAPEQAVQSVNLEQLVEAPETMRPDQILAAQKQVGNQMVQRALDVKKKSDAMTDAQGYLKGEINNAIQSKRGGGSSLPDPVREVASKNLKHDFKDVRIHTDEKANELSQSINARAFTIGKDIFFKKGVFAPGSKQGRETIMHELTHVVQQSGSSGASGRLKLGAPDTSHEKQADQIGKANSSVDAVSSGVVGGAVQKQGNSTGLPDNLKSGIENLSGMSLDDVRVHRNSSKPAQVQAHAYAQGSNIHMAPGQERHLPHEAWHTAQQKQGRVQPTMSVGGGPINDDSVQAQPDPVVQREEMPEDELQMQPDTGVVQREEMPEDELQMQPDAGVVQREEMPEDELQMQPDTTVQRMEEDELQAQPDAGGLVQRMEEEELQAQPDAGGLVQRMEMEMEEEELQAQPDAGGLVQRVPGDDDDIPKAPPVPKKKPTPPTTPPPVPPRRVKPRPPTTPSPRRAKPKPPSTPPPVPPRPRRAPRLPGTPPPVPPRPSRAPQTSSIPVAPPLPGQKTGFAAEIAAKSKSMKSYKQTRNLAKLESDRSEKVGKRVSEQYKEDKSSRFVKGAKKVGGFLGGLGKRIAGTKVFGELSEQVRGKKEEKKEEKSPVTVNVGGGGGDSGGFAMLEKYITENQKLKAENEELKAKVAN